MIAAIAARPAFAVQCGDIIQTDLTLTSNLNCVGTALRVFGPLPGAPNITIDLNGHDITGDGTGMGIFVIVGKLTLKVKAGFQILSPGFLVTAQDVVIYDLTVENNLAGIVLSRLLRIRHIRQHDSRGLQWTGRGNPGGGFTHGALSKYDQRVPAVWSCDTYRRSAGREFPGH